MEHLRETGCDICLVQETRLTDKDTAKLAEIRDYGMEVISNPRKHRSGGGIAIIYKNSIRLRTNTRLMKYSSFQVMETTMSTDEGIIRLINVYRPPYSKKARFTEAHFLVEFEKYLKSLDDKDGKKLIAGDFNIHMEKTEETYTRQLNDLLGLYSLKQIVPLKPTHDLGGTIDLIVIDEELEDNVQEVKIIDSGTNSDHFLVICDVKVKTVAPSSQDNITNYRDFSKIDIETFKSDIMKSELSDSTTFSSLDEAVDTYNNVLTRLMDNHSPVIRKKIKKKPTPWLDEELQNLRRKKRAAERKYRKPAATSKDKQAYSQLRKAFNDLSFLKKRLYHQKSLKASSGDVKSLYKKIDKLLGNVKDVLPEHTDAKNLAERFKEYFTSKIGKIRSEINDETKTQRQRPKDNDPQIKNEESGPYNSQPDVLGVFENLSMEDLKQMVRKLSNKFCCLDPIPTFLLKECIDELSPILLYIMNESLKTGVFPDSMKSAVVKPTIKKTNADADTLSNYRPVSNLSTVSKLLEKAVLQQLNQHLDDKDLYCSAQSGYRKNHSCETLLIRMSDDLIKCVSEEQTVMIILLDLSAAFDTIDHTILLQKLHDDYKISGIPLQWITSYLKDRSFAVKINDATSSLEELLYGVPQGSILGPILFILYTKELQAIAAKYGLEIQLYADDSQVYTGFNSKRPASIEDTRRRINSCMEEIKSWMIANIMKLNTGKTELLVCAKPKVLKYMEDDEDNLDILMGEDIIHPTNWKDGLGKSLGVLFDESLKMDKQIADVAKRCNWTLMNLRRIAYCLDEKTKIMLVKQLVLSKIDYCNALYMNLPATRVRRLQSVMNSAIRFIYSIKDRSEDLAPYYREAHILPFQSRVIFKACLMTHKAVHGMAPPYIRELVAVDNPRYSTRLTDDAARLVQCTTKTKLEDRMFSNYAPNIWNILPAKIRKEECTATFKVLLKTHFFSSLI